MPSHRLRASPQLHIATPARLVPPPASATPPRLFALSPIVGYQTQGYANDGYSICAASFAPITGTATLGDITPGEDFSESMLCFLTKTGANAKTDFGGKKVNMSYV